MPNGGGHLVPEHCVGEAASKARLKEREACAKLVESHCPHDEIGRCRERRGRRCLPCRLAKKIRERKVR